MTAVAASPHARVAGSPAPEYLTRQVGPLACRFVAGRAREDAAHPIPTVESLASEAYRVLPLKADVHGTDNEAEKRRRMLLAGPQRTAAKAIVTAHSLRDPSGAKYTASQLVPLVTVVRKELNAQLRRLYREQDKAAAERKRSEDRELAGRQRAAKQLVERATRKCACIRLPLDARPTKTACRDSTRPILQGAGIVRFGRGQSATWELVTTDSYQMVRYPLTLLGEATIRELTIGPECLKAIEKAGAFRITKQGLIQPVAYAESDQSVKVPRKGMAEYMTVRGVPVTHDVGEAFSAAAGRFPAVTEIWPAKDVPPTKRLEVTFDAALLAKIADATKGLAHVTLELDMRQFARTGDGVLRPTHKPGQQQLRVRPKEGNGVQAILMPVRT